MVQGFRAAIMAAAVAASSAQPVLAETPIDALAQMLSAKQKWTMSAPRNQQKPDCVETWTFAADGTMTVESGDERVQQQWHLGEDISSRSLHLKSLSSTGGRDCLGTETSPYDQPKQEYHQPIWMLVAQEGDQILLCIPAFVSDKKRKLRIPMFGDNCWGKLEPAQ